MRQPDEGTVGWAGQGSEGQTPGLWSYLVHRHKAFMTRISSYLGIVEASVSMSAYVILLLKRRERKRDREKWERER